MRRMGKWLAGWVCLLGVALNGQAQQYTGMTGLLHTPSAEMNEAGTARIGGHFLNREFTPDAFTFKGKYHTADYYLNLTPFPWIELAYTCTLQKGSRRDGHAQVVEGGTRYYYQDRYFSVKVRPLKEGRWWPAIAIGANDPFGTIGGKGTVHKEEAAQQGDGKSQYFCNFYVAATKHLPSQAGEWGIHLAYRKYKRDYNRKWNGVVGGIAYRPGFAPILRGIAEYTGNEVNIGADCLLWKHLLVQVCLQNGKYFSGGLCFQMNLF